MALLWKSREVHQLEHSGFAPAASRRHILDRLSSLAADLRARFMRRSPRRPPSRETVGCSAYHRRPVGRRDFPPRLRDGAGSLVANGCAAAAGGRRIVRSVRAIRRWSWIAKSRRMRMRRIAEEHERHASAGRSRDVCRLRPRRELLHRDASRHAAARVHAAALRSAPLDHRGRPAVRPADVSQPDYHLARGNAQSDHAGGRRSGESGAALSGARRDANSSRAPMPGWSRASLRRAASRFSRTIRTWSGRSLRPGIRCISRRRAWT